MVDKRDLHTTVGAVEAINEKVKMLKEELRRERLRLVPAAAVELGRGVVGLGRSLAGAALIGIGILTAIAHATQSSGIPQVAVAGLVVAGYGVWLLASKKKHSPPDTSDAEAKIHSLQAEIDRAETKKRSLLLAAEDGLPATGRVSHGAEDHENAETRECPMCAERVKSRAKVCRYCGHAFTQ